MKKLLITILIVTASMMANASSIFAEGFEYANHDGESPIGWICDDDSWLCGYHEKDHNRIAHTGDWYAYTNSNDSWMFMEMFMSTQLKYRFSYWGISDGAYNVEIWAGSAPDTDYMEEMIFSAHIEGGHYEKISYYLESVPSDYQYFAIHASAEAGAYHLTIDDINVDMVEKYSLTVAPVSIESNMMPGTQSTFQFKFINSGYEPLTVYVTPHTEYFTDIHILANGVEATSFPAEPDEIVEITGIVTMMPEITEGTLTWIDLNFWLDCGCATAMFTLWAAAEMEAIDESFTELKVYPTISTGDIIIEGSGVVAISNSLGQLVLRKQIIEKEIVTLDKGLYFITINDRMTKKLIVR